MIIRGLRQNVIAQTKTAIKELGLSSRYLMAVDMIVEIFVWRASETEEVIFEFEITDTEQGREVKFNLKKAET